MKPGQVVRLRLNPKDCQSVLDVLESTGVNLMGMSYAQCVSLALSTLLETCRKNGLIPEPDPFQFLNRIQPILQGSTQGRKLAVNGAITSIGPGFQAPVMDMPTYSAEPVRQHTPAAEVVTAEMRMQRRRLGELCQKKDLIEQGTPGLLWSTGDEDEFQELYKAVYEN